MMLYSTLLCKKIAREPGGHKKFMLTKLGGGGGGQNRSEQTCQFWSQLYNFFLRKNLGVNHLFCDMSTLKWQKKTY